MSKEVMNKGTGSVALFGNDLDQGFENVTQDDTSLPYVRILGQLSPQVTDGDAKYIDGAKPGMIFNNVTNEIFDGKKGIKVVSQGKRLSRKIRQRRWYGYYNSSSSTK